MTEPPAPCGQAPSSDFEAKYSRVFEAAGCRTQAELAAFLNIRQGSISDAKRRQSVPSDWIIKLYEKKRINPDWVLTGLGEKTVRTDADAAFPSESAAAVEQRPAESCTTDELLAELVRRVLKVMG